MTNEKALKILKSIDILAFRNKKQKYFMKDVCDAQKVAVKALEQQPCEDCFTDEEKRIFLASVAREMRVCEVIDSEKTKVKLVPILERVKNKVLRSSLW